MTWNPYLLLMAGVVCAGAGGELFLRGSVGIAQWARVSPGIIGATVAAFATSSPELSVAISSALSGDPEIALGDVTGSSVVNIALILGIALLFSGIQAPSASIRRDYPVALLAPLLILAFGIDGRILRAEAAILLMVFGGWLWATIRKARRQRSATAEVLGDPRHAAAILRTVSGLALLIASGRLIVSGGVALAMQFGASEFLIGATIVAIGTSMPELATTVFAKLRGHDEVALGTVLGSNIFNTFAIVGVAAMITPIRVDFTQLSVAIAFGAATLLLVYPPRSGWISRRRGMALVVSYLLYLGILVSVRVS